MTKLHPNDGLQILTEPFSKTRRVTEVSERRSVERTRESAQPPNTSIERNWATLAIWGFVVFSFATLFFCVYLIYEKCHGGWSH
jgi:hypothetical protein